MADVFLRVRAMPALTELWPKEPGVGSDFASDVMHVSVSSYTVARILLLEAIGRVQAAAGLAQDLNLARQGAHFLLLRPALVSTAKAAWLIEVPDPAERTSRAARLVGQDRRQGAIAMRKAVEQGAPGAFGIVGNAYEQVRTRVISEVQGLTADAHKAPPREESMITDLGSQIDMYYGTSTAKADVQLLWNTASSLAHGERWYSTLTASSKRKQIADTLTERSFDVICSGLNVACLRVLELSAMRNTN